MEIRALLFNIIFLFTSFHLAAQDASFSQFYHAPTMFNPAETGHRTTGGKYRLNGVHRNLGEGFKTTNLSFDNTIDWQDKSYMGWGLAFIHDATPSGGFRTMTFLGGVSIHLSLNRSEKHFLSFGSQFGIINNRVKVDQLRFENDILGGESETFLSENLSNLDSRLGCLYTFFPDEISNLKIGISANHVISFSNEFISGMSNSAIQFTGSIDYTKSLDDERTWVLNPHLLFIRQGVFNQGLIGCVVTRNMKSENGFSVGLSYKTANLTAFNTMDSKDSVIGIFGFNVKTGSRFYISYDANISPLNNTNSVAGSVEFGFQYIINSAKNNRVVAPDILRNQGN